MDDIPRFVRECQNQELKDEAIRTLLNRRSTKEEKDAAVRRCYYETKRKQVKQADVDKLASYMRMIERYML